MKFLVFLPGFHLNLSQVNNSVHELKDTKTYKKEVKYYDRRN